MKRFYISLCTLLCILVTGCGGSGIVDIDDGKNNNNNNGNNGDNEDEITVVEPEVGKIFPDWSEGCLDIHAINTGRGESSLLIFPDGTTMLIDAASSEIDEDDDIPPPLLKPAGSDPATTITNYVRHYIKAASGKLNYMMISHWHGDHIGGPPTASMKTHTPGGFILCGATVVGANVRVDKFIDRGTTYPKNMVNVYTAVANYLKFVDWAKKEYGSMREEAVVGVNSQLVLKEHPEKYSDFMIRNLAANGVAWTGYGTAVRSNFPADINEVLAASFDENKYSIAFHLRYGAFDFFSGGDLSYSGRSSWPWYDVEAPVAAAIYKLEVMKAHHHGTANCNSDEFLRRTKPDAVIIHTWRDVQPNPATIARMFAASPDCNIFTTNMTENNKKVLGAGVTAKLKSMGGHTVVRVDPGGYKYSIYVLDDSNENYTVQKIFGPYQCN